MHKLLAGALTAAAIGAFGGTALAAGNNICVWTGADWACGDGNVFPQHYSQSAGPNTPITPIVTIDQARDARLADPNRPH